MSNAQTTSSMTEQQALEQAKAELEKLYQQGQLSEQDYQTSLAALKEAQTA